MTFFEIAGLVLLGLIIISALVIVAAAYVSLLCVIIEEIRK